MLNKLRGDPVIRKHYQFWFYSYPTGYPFRHNADERAAVRPTSDRVTVNLPLCLLCCRRRRDSGPFCKQTKADGQQGWPDEHADETKNQCAPSTPKKIRMNGRSLPWLMSHGLTTLST